MIEVQRRTLPQRTRARGRYHYVSVSEGKRLLDRQARKYLGMSGQEFARKYNAHEIPDPDRSDVIRVAMLLPFTEVEG